MIKAIEDLRDQVTEERLAQFEEEIGARLPTQYREFLLQFNGGRPSPDVVDVEGLPGGAADVQAFFGIGGPMESYDLSENRTTLSERIPPRLLPIACDSGGSVFCISIEGRDRGAVSYCDLQSVYADFESDPDFYPVASDFDGFLGKLREL